MTRSRSELVRMSAEVAAKTSLVDLRTRKISAELLTPLVSEPITLAFTDFKRALTRVPGHAVYNLTYALHGTGDEGLRIFRASLTLTLIFKLADEPEVGPAALRAFGAVAVPDIAHPYLRELIHSLSWRMGLPPLVLDVSPPVDQL